MRPHGLTARSVQLQNAASVGSRRSCIAAVGRRAYLGAESGLGGAQILLLQIHSSLGESSKKLLSAVLFEELADVFYVCVRERHYRVVHTAGRQGFAHRSSVALSGQVVVGQN